MWCGDTGALVGILDCLLSLMPRGVHAVCVCVCVCACVHIGLSAVADASGGTCCVRVCVCVCVYGGDGRMEQRV